LRISITGEVEIKLTLECYENKMLSYR
jgi:hypothetical protein